MSRGELLWTRQQRFSSFSLIRTRFIILTQIKLNIADVCHARGLVVTLAAREELYSDVTVDSAARSTAGGRYCSLLTGCF